MLSICVGTPGVMYEDKIILAPFPPEIVLSKLDNQEGVLGAISVGIEKLHEMPSGFGL